MDKNFAYEFHDIDEGDFYWVSIEKGRFVLSDPNSEVAFSKFEDHPNSSEILLINEIFQERLASDLANSQNDSLSIDLLGIEFTFRLFYLLKDKVLCITFQPFERDSDWVAIASNFIDGAYGELCFSLLDRKKWLSLFENHPEYSQMLNLEPEINFWNERYNKQVSEIEKSSGEVLFALHIEGIAITSKIFIKYLKTFSASMVYSREFTGDFAGDWEIAFLRTSENTKEFTEIYKPLSEYYYIYPDYGGAYLWADEGGCGDISEFDLHKEYDQIEILGKEFEEWQHKFEVEEFYTEKNIEFDWIGFHQEGLGITLRLYNVLKDTNVYFIYTQPFEENCGRASWVVNFGKCEPVNRDGVVCYDILVENKIVTFSPGLFDVLSSGLQEKATEFQNRVKTEGLPNVDSEGVGLAFDILNEIKDGLVILTYRSDTANDSSVIQFSTVPFAE